ncbi:hypothetical protein H6F89_22385 [Cyanobacteria bacterium FACHB-63]|nr:hypothetical protein [Cyanobacteria bacterium FACHB-63]
MHKYGENEPLTAQTGTADLIRSHFHHKQHDLSAKRYREQMRHRLEDWWEITGVKEATQTGARLAIEG